MNLYFILCLIGILTIIISKIALFTKRQHLRCGANHEYVTGRTQDCTKQMVRNLQTGSRSAISTMDICAETSASTVTKSQHASEALAQIVTALETISSMSHEIATAAAEQRVVGEDIAMQVNMIEESSCKLSSTVSSGE
ncbi:methyl-accepting chemotaxis protein [Moritella sp. 28]|uniref:methyl-accepting chemotaxis protein n=1 Tax=Moritella sp. 28 TaxID=2746232 RepID=UPI002104690F|nr:methyl-accepting chemotaxis protein [Moritella sp. 28]